MCFLYTVHAFDIGRDLDVEAGSTGFFKCKAYRQTLLQRLMAGYFRGRQQWNRFCGTAVFDNRAETSADQLHAFRIGSVAGLNGNLAFHYFIQCALTFFLILHPETRASYAGCRMRSMDFITAI